MTRNSQIARSRNISRYSKDLSLLQQAVTVVNEEPEKPVKRTGREGAKTSFIDWFRPKKEEKRKVSDMWDLLRSHVGFLEG
jgi:hypothetical protein